MDRLKNLTTGNVFKSICIFSAPILIGNIFQQLYSTADTIIVGRLLGSDALAAVGSVSSIHYLIFMLFSGLSSGVTIKTSQYIGAGDEENVKKSVAVIWTLGAIVAVTITALCVVLLPFLMNLTNIPPEIYDRAYTYQIITIFGIAGTLTYNLASSLLRAIGDSRTPLYFLIFSTGLNIVLDIVFIAVFKTDVAGAALATIIAQLLSGITCVIYGTKKYSLLRLNRESFKFSGRFLWEHVSMGLPISVQNSITAIGNVIFQSVLNLMGSDSIAAYAVGSKIDSFAVMPMFAIGSSIVTFTAQNYGARNKERITRGVRDAFFTVLALSIVSAVLIITFIEPLVVLFMGDDATASIIDLSRRYITVEGMLFWTGSFLFIYRAAVQGIGATRVAMLGGFLELGGRLLASLVFARYFGIAGLGAAQPISWLLAGGMNTAYYFFAKKRRMYF